MNTKIRIGMMILLCVVLGVAATLLNDPKAIPESDFSEQASLKSKLKRNGLIKDTGPRAEGPNEFARILHEMRIPYGATDPSYPPNHKTMELAKATHASTQPSTILPWTERGPGNVPGRARGLVVDPGDPALNTWFVGSVGGGIWKTTNAGTVWLELTQNMPNLAVSVVIQSPSNPNIMYAGTGESFFSVDVVNGDGILKSTDRGATWFQLTSTASNDDFNNIARMIVDPVNPDIVIAATTSGRYRQNTVNRSGIWKSTNGGTSWYNVYNETEIGAGGRIKRVLHIVYPQGDFATQYAAVSEKGVIKSTDAGETWSLSSNGITGLTGRLELAIAPSNPNKIYGAGEGASSNLYVSSDAGANWTLTTVSGTNTNWLSAQGWYDNTIVVHPTDENKMYVGGVNLYTITMISETQRTISSIATGPVHVDHHNLMTVQNTGGGFRILNLNDGGIGVSTDSTTGWTKPGNGLNTSQFYGVDKKPGASAYFGGMQDNGTYRSPDDALANSLWEFQIGGDGYETSWHFDDPSKLIGGSQYNGIRRSTNGGGSFSTATTGMTGNTGSGNAPFITKIAKTNMEPDLLFAVGRSGVFKSTNFGANWTLTAIAAGTWGNISSFHNVKISRANPDIVWAGARMDPSAKIHLSTDRGATFLPVPDYSVTTLGGISGLSTHPLEDSTAYVLFSFAAKPKVLRTTDLGQNWEDISGFHGGSVSTNGFPDVAVYDLLVLPHTPNVIWAGTEIGLFESTDNGASWHLANNGLPSVCIWFMTHVENEVVVATHGRGIWSVDIPGMSAGQTFKPLLGSVAQGPDGQLAIEVTRRSVYDSTIVLVDDMPFVRLGANATAPTDTIVKYPVVQAGTVVVSATSYKNGSAYPSVGRSVPVILFAPPQTSYANDFNTTSNDFTGSGFTIQPQAGFNDDAIHTAHQYPNNANLTYMLTIPIIVGSSNYFIAYDDVALVEPGEDGAPFGDPAFYDYVVAEGSRDGVTWIPFADGYDARYDAVWLAAYNANTPGDATMYRHHEINILNTFSAGEHILVRFRLYSDASVRNWGWAIDNVEIGTTTGVGDGKSFPARFALDQNYPNPFNPSTTIEYSLPGTSTVKMVVYDLLGREVRTLLNNDRKEAGDYTIMWDGKSNAGHSLPSGTYFLRLEAGKHTATQKLMLLK